MRCPLINDDEATPFGMDLLLFEVLEAASETPPPGLNQKKQHMRIYAQLSLNPVDHVDWPDGDSLPESTAVS